MNIPEDRYELYAEFGLAAENAQVLEVEAGNVALAFLTVFWDTSNITAEESEMFSSIVDDVDRKTFGSLLRSIKKSISFDEATLHVVDEALERRNYLVHRFFPEHNFAIFDSEGRAVMIEELKEIQHKLEFARMTLSALSSALLKFGGQELCDERAKHLMERGKKVKI